MGYLALLTLLSDVALVHKPCMRYATYAGTTYARSPFYSIAIFAFRRFLVIMWENDAWSRTDKVRDKDERTHSLPVIIAVIIACN